MAKTFQRCRQLLHLACALLPGLVPLAQPVPPSTPAGPSYQLKQWTTDNGLPQSTITSLCQTRDGYLWIGTRRSLARFDGHTFKVFTDELTLKATGDLDCHELVEDSEGWLWVRTGEALIALKNGVTSKYSTREGPLAGDIQAVRANDHGGLLLTLNGELVHFNEGKIFRPPQFRSVKANTGEFIRQLGGTDPEGRLWMSALVREKKPNAPSELTVHWIRYDPVTHGYQTIEEIVGPLPVTPETAFADRFGNIWLTTPDQLFCFLEGAWKSYSFASVWAQGKMGLPQTLETSGAFWFKPYSGPIIQFRNGIFTVFGERDAFPDQDLRNLIVDREGNIWVGTGVGGLLQFQPRHFASLLLTNEVGQKNEVYSVAPGTNGKVWFGMDSGLMLKDGNQWTLHTNSHVGLGGRFHQNIAPVITDNSGNPWFGLRPEGLFTLRQGDFASQLHRLHLDLNDWTITALLRDHEDRIWIGSQLGLLCWRNGQILARYTKKEGLSDNLISGILPAPDHSLWIGTINGGLNHFVNGSFSIPRAKDGTPVGTAIPLAVEPDGTLWFSHSKGLSRIHDNEIRTVTSNEGLFDGMTTALLDDQLGSYWASTDKGIWRVKKAGLHAVADGHTNHLQCLHYGAADGMMSTEGNGDRQPSPCRTPDGLLWFPARRGVNVVNPSSIHGDEIAPILLIEKVAAENKPVWGRGATSPITTNSTTAPPLALPAGSGRVIEIHYTTTSFTSPEKIRFKYKLEGHDTAWLEDDNNRRVVYYSNLKPGNYTFRVIACNSHLFWNQTGATLAFSIAPFFYQTWPFYAASALMAFALIGGIHYYRLTTQRRILALEKQTALDRERARIAQDIHDDLGSRLSQLAILGELAERQMENPDSARPHLRKMMTSTKDMFQAMDEIVWAVNPKLDSIAGLATYLREYVPEILEPAGIRCRLEIPVEIPAHPLSAEIRHHLFLVIKEALRNVVQHAHATEVRLHMLVTPSTLEFSMEDNGRGFQSNSAATGNGLKNMRNRMDSIGGSLLLKTQPGSGTQLRLTLPL